MNLNKGAAKKLGNAKGYKTDVSKEEEVKKTVDQIMSERGTVNVLVNNAGLQYISKMEDSPLENGIFY